MYGEYSVISTKDEKIFVPNIKKKIFLQVARPLQPYLVGERTVQYYGNINAGGVQPTTGRTCH